MKRAVVTITGPSGSGKSTLEQRLVDAGFAKIISTTTRAPREGEKDGVDYYFVSNDDFNHLAVTNSLVEMVHFKGNNYAVESDELGRAFAEGQPVVIVCEPEGASQIKEYCNKHDISLLSVCLTKTLQTLVERFISRELLTSGMVKVDYLSSRLINLIKRETEWSHMGTWDVVFDSYDENTEDYVVEFIERHVDLRLKAA